MRSGFFRFIHISFIISFIGTLTVFSGTGRSIERTAFLSFGQNAQSGDQEKKHEVPPPASLPEQQNKKEVVFSRHEDVIPSVAFSPDGKRLASAGDNCVKITDLETGKELMKLKNSRGMHYFSVAYSPDGRTIAGAQSMLKERVNRRKGDTIITTLTYFGEILVWDAQTGAVKATLNDDDGPAWSLAFSPDGKWLAIATGPTPEEKECEGACPAYGEITLWDTRSWKLIRRVRGGSAAMRALAFSPDGRLIAGGAALMDGGRGASVEEEDKFEIFLWDVSTGELRQKIPAHTNSITALAFSPDNNLLASAGRDRTLKVWDCRTFGLKKMASDHMLSVEEMQTIADATNAKSLKNSMPPVSWLNAISFTHDGKQIIAGSGDSIIRLYDSESVKIVGVLKPRGWPILRSFISTYSSIGNSAATPTGAMIPRGPAGRGMNPVMIRGRWPYHPGSLNSLALAPDGRTIAIGNSDGKIRLITLK